VSMNLKTQFWEKNNCVLIWYVCAHRREQEWSHTMREKMCVSESDNKFENKIKWWYITSDIFFLCTNFCGFLFVVNGNSYFCCHCYLLALHMDSFSNAKLKIIQYYINSSTFDNIVFYNLHMDQLHTVT
jgi:hypothetical protein